MAYHIFYGNDIKYIRQKSRELETKFLATYPDLEIYNFDNPNLTDIIEKVSQGSLFGTKTLVKLYDFMDIKNIEKLFDIATDHEVIAICYEEKINAKIIAKGLVQCYNLPKNYELEKIIAKKFQEQIDPLAIDYLSKSITSILDLDELLTRMKEQHIQHLTMENLMKIKDDTDIKPYLIAEDIFNQKMINAILHFNDFMDQGGNCGAVIAAINKQLQQIHSIKTQLVCGSTIDQIAKEIRLPVFVVKKLAQTASRYPILKLEKLMLELPLIDFKTKFYTENFNRIFVERLILDLRLN